MNKNKKDYLLNSLIYQSIVCIVLFISVYAFKQTNSHIYDFIKNEFFSNTEENILINYTLNESKNINDNIKVNENNESDDVLKTNEANENELSVNEEITLTAEIGGKGGKDYSVKKEETIPDNVSVNNYSLNQNIVNPVSGRISSPFGIRKHPITGELRFHAGIDIATDSGTPIYSAFDGQIIKASYDAWNGYYLKIKHENNIMTVYCHCKELKVKTGDSVKAGDVVATVGSTGSSTGPHLHFELRINDVSYDPEIALETAVNGI